MLAQAKRGNISLKSYAIFPSVGLHDPHLGSRKSNNAFTAFPTSIVTVHADTAITNDHCLNRLHKKFDKLLDVPTQYEAIDAVLNGTVRLIPKNI